MAKRKNPSLATTLKRDVWVPAKVMVTKAGKILAKVTGTAKANPKRKPAKRKAVKRRKR